jgi:hypothetical protein
MEELTTETQRRRETTRKIAETQRSGEQEGLFPSFYLMLFLCAFVVSCFWGFLRALHRGSSKESVGKISG